MKKIAFISAHHHPQTDNTLRILKENFPDYNFDIFRIVDLIKKNKSVASINIFHTLKEYGLDVFLGKKNFKKYVYFRTVYLFNKIKQIVNKELKKRIIIFHSKSDQFSTQVWKDFRISYILIIPIWLILHILYLN